MTVALTYFVHGATLGTESGISLGWKDEELSELGVQQSKELAEKIRDQHFDVVFTSDLERAKGTAEIAFGGKCKVIEDKRLRECNYGDYNGQLVEFVGPLKVKSITTPMPNGESYEDVKQRVGDFLQDLVKHYDGKRVAIVSHEAPQLALDVLLNGMTWEEAFANNWRNTKAWQPGWVYHLKTMV